MKIYKICEECGNTEKFYCLVTSTRGGTIYFSGEEGPEDGRYQDDTNENPNYEDTKCTECESDNIEEFSTDLLRTEYMAKHTDENDNWSQDELEPKERNKELMKEVNVAKL